MQVTQKTDLVDATDQAGEKITATFNTLDNTPHRSVSLEAFYLNPAGTPSSST